MGRKREGGGKRGEEGEEKVTDGEENEKEPRKRGV